MTLSSPAVTPPAAASSVCGLITATPCKTVSAVTLYVCCRQMKRLYSECSQEEEDPTQLLTPEELAAQQAQVRMLAHAYLSHNLARTHLQIF